MTSKVLFFPQELAQVFAVTIHLEIVFFYSDLRKQLNG